VRQEYTTVALQAAHESITLLQNKKNLLPLAKGQKVLVTGPTADSMISLNNGWTYVWQGSESSLYPNDKPTVQAAIAEKLGAANVTFVPGTRIVRKAGSPSNNNPTNIDQEVDIDAAVRAARDADSVVLCLGEGSYTEHPGSINDLTLPDAQLKLAEAIIATGKPVVLVLVEGRPRIITRIADKVDGIVMAYNPGNEGGRAIADVLFGDYNPDGKLPITYPRAAGYFPTYDAQPFGTFAPGDPFTPLFEFGTGLSYTTFKYSDLTLSSTQIGPKDVLSIIFTVTNTGSRAGKETVILYLRDEVASMTPAAKRVRRFAKVSIAPGDNKTISFTLNRKDLQFINLDNKPTVEPGEFTIMVGDRSAKFTLK
jgi:beta-glucosidase